MKPGNGIQMSHKGFVVVIAALALLRPSLEIPFARAEIVQALHSRIAIDLPEGFQLSNRFSGFIDKARGVSIVVAEFPAPAYASFLQGFTSEALAAKSIHRTKRGVLTTRPDTHLYINGVQDTPIGSYVKHILVFQNPALTGLVTVNALASSVKGGKITEAEIERILVSARVVENRNAAPSLFQLSYVGLFEENVALTGTTKAYRLKSISDKTETSGEDDISDATLEGPSKFSPIFVIAPSLHSLPIRNLEVISHRAFTSIDSLEATKVEQERIVHIAGLDGIELIGSATQKGTNEPAFVYQMLLSGINGGYFRVLGLAHASEKETYLPEFRKMAASFKLANSTDP